MQKQFKNKLPVSSTPMATPCNENITARTTNVSAHGIIIVATAATKRVAVSNNCLSKMSNKKPQMRAPNRYPTDRAENINAMCVVSVLTLSPRSSNVGPGIAMHNP